MSGERIQVTVRVRPMLASDAEGPACVRSSPPDGIALDGLATPMRFDRVLSPHDGQAEAFRSVREVVAAVADGYNATVLAYGQTGSGKTHTMTGEGGILPSAIRELLGEVGVAAGNNAQVAITSHDANGNPTVLFVFFVRCCICSTRVLCSYFHTCPLPLAHLFCTFVYIIFFLSHTGRCAAVQCACPVLAAGDLQ
jgi:hypothetical protein